MIKLVIKQRNNRSLLTFTGINHALSIDYLHAVTKQSIMVNIVHKSLLLCLNTVCFTTISPFCPEISCTSWNVGQTVSDMAVCASNGGFGTLITLFIAVSADPGLNTRLFYRCAKPYKTRYFMISLPQKWAVLPVCYNSRFSYSTRISGNVSQNSI